MTTEVTKTKFRPIAIASLSPDQAKAYKAVQDAMAISAKAYKAMKTAEDACTALMLAGQTAPDGKAFKVVYRYGLAVGLVDADTVQPKAAKGAVSLADWVKQQAA